MDAKACAQSQSRMQLFDQSETREWRMRREAGDTHNERITHAKKQT